MVPLRRFIAATCLLAAALAGSADAQTSDDRGASILVFPNVASDAAADTVLQLVNVANSRVYAGCFYIDGASWQASSFSVELGPLQTLHWVASTGREAGVGDANQIPPAPAGFRGALECIQEDGTGAPFGGNRLAGQATLGALDGGDVAGYAAVGLSGFEYNDGDANLCIGGDASELCLFGSEYAPCPAEWILTHAADGAADAQLGEQSALSTRVAILSCSHNLRDGEPRALDIALTVTNEFEQQFSDSVSVTGWGDLSLADGLFERGRLGGDIAHTRLAPAAASGGFTLVALAERRASASAPVLSRAAINCHHQGAGPAPDLIVLP
ncbi:MAG: hypothetical protein AB7P78_12665 [Candidatus Binatia bacterium]